MESDDIRSTDLLAVSFGGGDNSTAVLCGLYERGIRPDIITFADTGGEKPHTERHVALMQPVVKLWWNMQITIVRKLYQGRFEGLEGECLRGHKLPALAYGSRACSVKYKIEPQNRAVKQMLWMRDGLTAKDWRAMKKAGDRRIVKVIGYHADEAHRVKVNKEEWWHRNWYPLIEWGWRHCDCVRAMMRNGIMPPGKSACFYCPANKPGEVINMRKEHPMLLARALAIEDGATANTTVRGLGGENNKWRDWIENDKQQGKLLDIEPMHLPCGCSDG